MDGWPGAARLRRPMSASSSSTRPRPRPCATSMQRYLELGSVRALVAELAREGRVTKVQVLTSTGHRGGIPFARGTLFHLLKNRIYRGEIVHRGVAHPGEHPAIVPDDLWDAGRSKGSPTRARADARRGRRASEPARAGCCVDGGGVR